MTIPYDPAAWFWIVGGDEARLWSSAAGAYVPAKDRSLAAWVEAGGLPTRIVSEAELGDVLREYGLQGPIKTLDPLDRVRFMIALDYLEATTRPMLAQQIEAVIAAMPQDTPEAMMMAIAARRLWSDGQRFERDNPIFLALAAQVGISSEEIDAAWRMAAEVPI